MGIFSPSGASSSGSGSSAAASLPVVVNIDLTVANTEYSYTLPANTKRFLIKLRGQAFLKLAFGAGTSGTVFVTIPPNANYAETELLVPSLTLFFQSPTSTQLAEIVSWS